MSVPEREQKCGAKLASGDVRQSLDDGLPGGGAARYVVNHSTASQCEQAPNTKVVMSLERVPC